MNKSAKPSPQAQLDRLGLFRDPAVERSFMEERWPQDASRMRWLCLITSLAEIATIFLDATHFSGWKLLTMGSARGLAVVFGLNALRMTFRTKRPRWFHAALVAYMLLVGVHEGVELWLLQVDHLAFAPLTLVLVLMFYMFLPPSLATGATGGLGTTVIYIFSLAFLTPAPLPDLCIQIVFFSLANGFGIYFLMNYGRVQRREFWMLREMHRVNEALVNQVSATAEANRRLRELASTDALTGAMNRRRFFEVLEAEFVRARRYGHGLSVVMFDLDHFKQVNDRYGHAAGDEALRHVAGLILARQRAVDAFGRLGGEEFALLLPEAGMDQARTAAERICVLLAESPVDLPEGPVPLTLSAGVATIQDPDPDPDSLLSRADSALYAAKRNGRNQLCCNPDEPRRAAN